MSEVRRAMMANPESAIDYVDAGGTLVKDSKPFAVLIRSESDLAGLPSYPAGTIAFTAGFGSMWQLDASGEWQEV